MPFFYFDTSAIIKRYVREAGSDWVEDLCRARNKDTNALLNTIFIGDIAFVEVAAAIARRVNKTKELEAAEGRKAYILFSKHAREEYQLVHWTSALIDSASVLAESHVLRALDAIHLALAKHLQDNLKEFAQPLTFISSDKTLFEAGRAEGLAVDDPNDHAE